MEKRVTSDLLETPSGESAGKTLGGQIAQQIEDDIRRQGWREGHLIGGELDLTARYGVGVAAVREASRILQARGLARARRGPGGGLFVTVPERRLVTDAARRHMEHIGVEREELFEVWLALEQVAVARLAADIDPAGAAKLRSLLNREDQNQNAPSWEELPNIHLAIARLAGNRALELFIQVLVELSLTQYGSKRAPQPGVGWLHERHSEIVESIIAGDGPMAQLHLRRLFDQIARPDGIFSI